MTTSASKVEVRKRNFPSLMDYIYLTTGDLSGTVLPVARFET